jgi:hypothetical protein
MTEQRTPDELGIENEVICEKLLGWNRSSIVGYWFPSQEHAGTVRTPSFTTWGDAGLILDALASKGAMPGVHFNRGDWFAEHDGDYGNAFVSGPLAVRAAALEYIRSLP